MTVLSLADQTPCGTASGGLPGAITLELTAPIAAGGSTGTQTFDGTDYGAFTITARLGPYGRPYWDSGSDTNADGRSFTLFKMPAHSPAFPDNHEGGLAYSAVCAGYGLQPIGCGGGSTYNAHSWDATEMPMPGSWSCNIDGSLHTNTGWTGLAFYQSNGNMYGVNDGGGIDSPEAGTSPVCAFAH